MFSLFNNRAGRIVTTSIGDIIVGLQSKESILKRDTVYQILVNEYTGVITLEEVGKSHIDWKTDNRGISTILLSESKKVILTDKEHEQLKKIKE